jgi:ABC-type nitrate/sulfonate/bicarbonate transport system substrate-binding protein
MDIRTATARVIAAAMLAGAAALPAPATAAETLRIGKSVPEAFVFLPVDVGVRNGLFKKHGLDIDIRGFGGSAKLIQGLTSGGLDIGLGSGPDMAYTEKGAPLKAVGVIVEEPYIVLLANPRTVAKPADVRGKSIGMGGPSSLTGWLFAQLRKAEKINPDEITPVSIGGSATSFAALKSGQIDAMVTDLTFALRAEQGGQAKIVSHLGDYAKAFITNVVFATEPLLATKPDTVRAFLAGWYDSVKFMRDNKAATVKIAMEVLNLDEAIAARAYDELVPTLSTDGRFDPKALDVLKHSYVDLKILPQAPADMGRLYTEAFLPAR